MLTHLLAFIFWEQACFFANVLQNWYGLCIGFPIIFQNWNLSEGQRRLQLREIFKLNSGVFELKLANRCSQAQILYFPLSFRKQKRESRKQTANVQNPYDAHGVCTKRQRGRDQ